MMLTGANASRASAQDGYAARAQVQARLAPATSEDATASGTRIAVQQRSNALESVADIVSEAPGTRIQDNGGFGASSGVALRGASIEHTTVLLGDMPLSSVDTGAFNLSLVPPDVLESIEIYRGGAPIWWSDGSIGGVVRLIPRSAKQSYLEARTGYGSFGRFELAATSSVVRDGGVHPAFLAHVGFARADNDYSYIEDGQTRFDTASGAASDDDLVVEQRNAQIDSGNALAHAGIDALGGRLALVLAAHGRTEGVPGPLAAPTDQVHRKLVHSLGALSWTKEAFNANGERRYRVQALASAIYQSNQLSDLEGQLGISQRIASDDEWTHAYARVAGSVAALRFLEPTLIATIARDDYRPENTLARGAVAQDSGRSTQALAFEPRLHGTVGDTRLELRPSARAQWTQTSVWSELERELAIGRKDRDDALATLRVAGVIAPWPALAFSASASTGARTPSILELFGDRLFHVPSPDLKPEKSQAFDLSVVTRGRTGDLRGSVELRGFALFIEDLIAYHRTSQLTFRAENTDSASILGGELGLDGGYGRHVSISSSLTAMQTRNQFDHALPLRPPLTLSVRPEVVFFPGFADRVTLFVETEHTSFMYLDDASRTLFEARTLFSVGAALAFLDERIVVLARAQNVLDTLATDVLSRPLPGTQLFVSVTARERLE